MKAALTLMGFLSLGMNARAADQALGVRIEFGHRGALPTSRSVTVLPGSPGLRVLSVTGANLEPDESIPDVSPLTSGAGDMDALEIRLLHPEPTGERRKVHSIWQYLLEHGSPGQVARLKDDPSLFPDAPLLTIRTDADGTRGFSVPLDQLTRHRALWLPEQDAFITLADDPVAFGQHAGTLRGERLLDRIRHEPEASLDACKAIWEDVGNPIAWNKPWETTWLGTRGHLVVTAAEHGSVYKFAIDRHGAVRPDFASPHQFRLDPIWPEGTTWKQQRIVDGLPILVTRHEIGGREYEMEQFAARLPGMPGTRRGEPHGVFLTRVRPTRDAGTLRLKFRLTSELKDRSLAWTNLAGHSVLADRETGGVWLVKRPGAGWKALRDELTQAPTDADQNRSAEFACVEVQPDAPLPRPELLIQLFSPPLPPDRLREALRWTADEALASTRAYWEDWLAQGATFQVPEQEVNNLFRANLWHALVLPRHRSDEHGKPRIDLPYANTAYGQLNADWPINQAVYVDYMLYGLRGHWAVAEQEYQAMFDSQQQPDGRIAGYANWGVYSPAQLYAIGQHCLLSRDGGAFRRLLPRAEKTLAWCLRQLEDARRTEDGSGLIRAPLNDLTHAEREWGFPQAYYAAGLETFGRALSLHQHPRATEVLSAASRLRNDIHRAFARASVRSPVVPLADGTWINYVPSDAMTPRRLLEEWYPTDVDCGPLHMSRLSALDPMHWLTTAMLHDHEDNLFLNQAGAANEPVYNQQATVYLLRDQPEAAIRSFYSMMACAFSHGQLSPLEHRWAWGQYFGPPSTDGAWFELYRNMLLRERDDGSLLVAQATPRRWLEAGKRIEVHQAPTRFGRVSLAMQSRVDAGLIRAEVNFHGADQERPADLLVRFRHPAKLPIQRVAVNGAPSRDFDLRQEWVRIDRPTRNRYTIEVEY